MWLILHNFGETLMTSVGAWNRLFGMLVSYIHNWLLLAIGIVYSLPLVVGGSIEIISRDYDAA
jgi:hypothetical protein